MRTKVNYRKIYRDHYGPIPKDENGRTYEIHHIDGNDSNNHPNNLKAVSIREHYDIHRSQGDWAACQAISLTYDITPEERSELSRNTQINLVNENRHHFLGGQVVNQQIADGKNALVGGDVQSKTNKKRIANGTHQFLIENRNFEWNYDKIVYCWENIKTKEQVHMLRKDFIKKYKVNAGNVYSMLKRGTYKSVGGWRVVL
jgi:hypothetical protein